MANHPNRKKYAYAVIDVSQQGSVAPESCHDDRDAAIAAAEKLNRTDNRTFRAVQWDAGRWAFAESQTNACLPA